MKIIFCCRKESIDILKDTPTAHKTSKIKTKFTEPKYLRNKEFRSISNIEYLEFEEKPVFSCIYDSLMNRQLFEHNFHNLDHRAIFEDYVQFNKDMAARINEILENDDLVIINDSSLLLLPTLISARVAIRNLSFEGCFIEKIPFFKEIVTSIVLAQKFFDNKESLNSFNSYMDSSYPFKDCERGGCWHIKNYVDKFLILDTLEKIKKSALKQEIKSSDNPVIVLTDANLLHLEPFIKENPNVHIRYLRKDIEFNEEFSRMMQYLKKMYNNNSISIADPIQYSQLITEMFYCDVFVGSKNSELAQFFGKPVISDTFDSFQLKSQILEALNSKNTRHNVVGEEQYLMEFLRVNGYDLIIETDMSQDKDIDQLISSLSQCESIYFEKILKDGRKEYYNKVLSSENIPNTEKIDYFPILEGKNSYLEIKHKPVPKELKPIDIEGVKEHWKNSNKTLLLDYDGTLTPIVDDPDKASPPEGLIELLLKLNQNGRVVICSGRSKVTLDQWIPKEIEVYSEHGAFHRLNGQWRSLFTNKKDIERCKEIMIYYVKRTPGTFIEVKEAGIVLHYRGADENFNEEKLYILLKKVGKENIVRIKKGIEYRGGDKMKVCEIVEPALCGGDDFVDEEMFKACKGISIRVGEGKSFADGFVSDVPAFIKLLGDLSDMN